MANMVTWQCPKCLTDNRDVSDRGTVLESGGSMNVPDCMIELAAENGKDDYSRRRNLHLVKYDADKQQFLATDGHIAAIVPHSAANGDASCLIPAEAMATARKLKGRVEVEAGKAIVSNGTTRIEFPLPEKVDYPAVENYMGEKSEQFIEVNADLLATLAAALYQKSTGKYGVTRAVRIYFPADSGKPIRVETNNAVGTIMPCKLRG